MKNTTKMVGIVDRNAKDHISITRHRSNARKTPKSAETNTIVMQTYDRAGGPPIDWKKRHDDLLKHVTTLGAAASILRDDHKTTPHCEFPRTCGGCHFWTGVIEACRDLETGDKTTIRKAHAIVIGSQNK